MDCTRVVHLTADFQPTLPLIKTTSHLTEGNISVSQSLLWHCFLLFQHHCSKSISRSIPLHVRSPAGKSSAHRKTCDHLLPKARSLEMNERKHWFRNKNEKALGGEILEIYSSEEHSLARQNTSAVSHSIQILKHWFPDAIHVTEG